MAKNSKEKTYWPHMILGFLCVGITLSYWTVKSASSIPVQESNNFMMKYQQADIHINEILKRKALFDQNFMIEIIDVEKSILELENAKRAKNEEVIKLSKGKNHFGYYVKDKKGNLIKNAKVTFLLTRPHSVSEDILVKDIAAQNGKYMVENITIVKAGRYTLQLKAKIGDAIGYSEIPAYLKP